LVVSNTRQASQIVQELHSVQVTVGTSLRARQQDVDNKIGQIRRAYFEQHRSIKEIVRTLSVSRATVRKVIRGHKTEFKYERGVQPTPKLGDWVEVLTEILEQEAKLPKRARRSTQRLFEELRGRGYAGAHDSVHRFVKAWRDERVRVPVQAYVPMSFAPGEAYQFDWRDDHAPGPAADGQGGAHEAVAQPHAVCARLLSGDPGWCSTPMTRRSGSMAGSAGAASTTT
jgi:hypothetical protein